MSCMSSTTKRHRKKTACSNSLQLFFFAVSSMCALRIRNIYVYIYVNREGVSFQT
jgi:hypothetical protein